MTRENLLARYAILHELGRGATGAVYAARDRETGEVVALKRLDPALSSKSGAGFADRIVKHARAARLLKHPNIARIHDAGEVAGTVHVVMEMLEGQSLRQVLDAGPVPIARAIHIVREIASGLAHAHLEGVVHGALKPSNVIVLRSGGVKITDFGMGQAAPLPEARAGGASYIAPEQLRGGPVDHRCDIFSLGALFYELLAHRPPTEGGSPSELNPHVPRALDAIVLKMLAADPAARMPGAPILLRELQRLEEALGLESGARAVPEETAPRAEQPRPEPTLRTPEPNFAQDRASAPVAPEFDYEAIIRMEQESRHLPPRTSRTGLFATLGLVLAVGIVAAGYLYVHYSPGLAQQAIAAIPLPRAERQVARAPEPPAAPPMAAKPVEEAPVVVPPTPAVVPAAPAVVPAAANAMPPEPPREKPAPPAPEPAPATPPAPKVAEQQPPRNTARLMLAVSPRGEVYIDGRHHGMTPPLTTLDLEPGMHRVEVRSGSRKPYLTYVMVQAGDVRRIRHAFDASRAVNPPGRLARRNDP